MLKTILVVILLAQAGTTPVRAQVTAVLRPGDAIRVTVWRSSELTGEFSIASDGTVSHPLYHEINVSGKTMKEIESDFRTLLGKISSAPQFVLEPRVRISVNGEVRVPNLYMVAPTTTVAEAIAIAGGATDRAKVQSIRIRRQGREMAIDLTNANDGLSQQLVLSGDAIFIDRKSNIFRDLIVPAASVIAAVAALTNIIVNK